MKHKPKYANHIFTRIIKLDSASYLNRATKRLYYIISDRYSKRVKGEDPEVVVSLIDNKKRGHQFRLAIRGKIHVEKPTYYVINPMNWREWSWILFGKDKIIELRDSCNEALDIINNP